MRNLLYFSLCIVIITLGYSCCPDKTPVNTMHKPIEGKGLLLADSVVFEVLIKNPNPNDTWTNKCLSNINHQLLIDTLFSMAYTGRYNLHDYFSGTESNYYTGNRLKPSDIRKLEKKKECHRSNIGKIQFMERWYLSGNGSIEKDIIWVVLAQEIIAQDGVITGYEPVFKMVLR